LTRARSQTTPQQRVLRFIKEEHLISRRQKLVVAVSGGPDSVCLLHIMVKLQKELDIKLHVAHLNHQLRGADSEADARYVAELAHSLDIPATVERHDVKSHRSRRHISLEEAAREVRYTFLAQVTRAVGAERVAVGHTADDHVETILMHLIRGSGTRGLKGLQPLSRWQSSGESLSVIRPLLPLSREETAAYCQQYRLSPCIDKTNTSMVPFRNRIRHELLPQLQSYNPQVAEALLRTARIAADELDFIDKEVARVWPRIVRKQENAVVLDRQSFLRLPPALKRHLLRYAIEELLGNLKDIEARHIEEVMAILSKPAGKKLCLPDGLTFAIDYDRYLLGSDAAVLSPFPIPGSESKLNVPGKTSVPGWDIEAIIADHSGAREEDEETNDLTAVFDFDKTGSKLTMRHRQQGDHFQPLGMSQPKKLSEFMIDAKIPQAWRQRIPIVCSPEQIIWVVGWRIDERARVTDNTNQILCLKFERSRA
jgi:tRNA(Ile)-lysidine synthase